jgi:hypothetical protein
MKAGIQKIIYLSLLTLLSLLLSACGNQDSASKKQEMHKMRVKHQQLGQHLLSRELQMAVVMIESNVHNIQDGGGYQMWTASKMVDKLLILNQVAHANPDNRQNSMPSSMPRISYVKDKVKKPWQVVLVPDDHNKQIIIKAYGNDINHPVITRAVHVSTY